ncbi:MAG: hypothetical protein RLZZ508_139 [Actinomycetota bacterium]
MPDKSDRASHFPAIEKKYGQPMTYWHSLMKELSDLKYPEQIAYLKENHGFSQNHANALVMYSRGSTTSKRFTTLTQYLEPHEADKKKTVKAIFKTLQEAFPKSELVMAWNQPMLKIGDEYIIGVSVLKNHILLGPWGKDVISAFEKRLKDYKTNKKTIQIPTDWTVDKKLLVDLAKYRIAEIKGK